MSAWTPLTVPPREETYKVKTKITHYFDETLSDKYVSNHMEQQVRAPIKKLYGMRPSEFLLNVGLSFVWHITPQGHEFWHEIYKLLGRGRQHITYEEVKRHDMDPD